MFRVHTDFMYHALTHSATSGNHTSHALIRALLFEHLFKEKESKHLEINENTIILQSINEPCSSRKVLHLSNLKSRVQVKFGRDMVSSL